MQGFCRVKTVVRNFDTPRCCYNALGWCRADSVVYANLVGVQGGRDQRSDLKIRDDSPLN